MNNKERLTQNNTKLDELIDLLKTKDVPSSENLTTELDSQDSLLSNLEEKLNTLPSGGSSSGIIPEGVIEIIDNGMHYVAPYERAKVNVEKGIFPEGTIEITENGLYNVTEYASANINVAGSTDVEAVKAKLKGIIDGTITELTANDLTGVTLIRMYLCYYCKNLVNVYIPEGVTEIGHSAFMQCIALKYVELPSTITNIASRAFMNSGVSGTLVIRIKATTPPTITAKNNSNGSFRYNGTYTIEVPQGTLDTYLSDTNWITYDVNNGGPATFVEYEEE